MSENRLEISIDKDKIRLDMAFSDYFEEHSRSYWQKLIGGGNVTVNGNVETSKNKKLKAGDVVVAEIPEDVEIEILAEDIPLNIVYEDDDVLVVDKPKDMVVHPAVGNLTGTLVNAPPRPGTPNYDLAVNFERNFQHLSLSPLLRVYFPVKDKGGIAHETHFPVPGGLPAAHKLHRLHSGPGAPAALACTAPDRHRHGHHHKPESKRHLRLPRPGPE